MISILMKILLKPQPKMNFDPEEIVVYNKLIFKMHQGQLDPKSIPFQKYRFLQYLALKEDFVFHGSNNTKIEILEPRVQTLFNGRSSKVVFATADPIWSAFYAVFDRSKLMGSFRNGCLVYKGKKYHYYSLNKSTMEKNPWTQGMIYIFKKDKFTLTDNRRIYFDEWVCYDSVKPVSQLEVSAEDFDYIDKVATHKNNESLIKTLLLYKMRTLRARSRTDMADK
ncbi:hypothetical protein [Oceanobacillus jeddahense]|uniref:hypothetical protein n=1 Tax=Oceanobacillus jeddahense TaxID=1462527 RepID=UPI00059615C5|nr:hypothetical protein [Oceanobacillus jeddahense]